MKFKGESTHIFFFFITSSQILALTSCVIIGNMRDAFKILTDSMTARGGENLVKHGKFSQSYRDAAME